MDAQVDGLRFVVFEEVEFVELEVGGGQFGVELVVLLDGKGVGAYCVFGHILGKKVVFEAFNLEFSGHGKITILCKKRPYLQT